MDAWQRVDDASPEEARAFLTTCCGSSRWVERMLQGRPFGSDTALLAAARSEWFALTPDDWKQAFSCHPRIGDRESLRARFPATADLSAREQSGVAAASEATLDALAAGNRKYEDKFGYIFIVCATGKTAGEMLAMLQRRLLNDASTEVAIAAEEQARITALRLRPVPPSASSPGR